MTSDRSYQAWCSGTWGELIQGEINGKRLLVSLPSSLGSTTRVRLRHRKRGEAPVVGAQNRGKSARAVELFLEALQVCDLQVDLTINSSLKQGVGHASSSADVLSALRATQLALGTQGSKKWLCRLASIVEPTNPCLIEEACLFDPDNGTVLSTPIPLPRFRIQMISCGAPVDTVGSRNKRTPWSQQEQRTFRRIIGQFQDGLEQRSPRIIAQAATRSALLHAERNDRQDIADAAARARRTGALGIAASHSGSSIVALYPPTTREAAHV